MIKFLPERPAILNEYSTCPQALAAADEAYQQYCETYFVHLSDGWSMLDAYVDASRDALLVHAAQLKYELVAMHARHEIEKYARQEVEKNG